MLIKSFQRLLLHCCYCYTAATLLLPSVKKLLSRAPRCCRGIYQEAEAILYKEIDYISEGRNADKFRRNFQDDPQIQVPRVYWQLTSPRAITLDYLPGTKITNVTALQSLGIDTAAVARRATEAYLVQILKHGFLHSDPHPGNIAVNREGGLIFYDFGMMSSIVPATKERLLDVFYGIYKKDAAQVSFSVSQLQQQSAAATVSASNCLDVQLVPLPVMSTCLGHHVIGSLVCMVASNVFASQQLHAHGDPQQLQMSSFCCCRVQVLRALTDLKIIVSRGDDLSLRRAITYFLNNIAKQTQEQETIAAIGEDMFAVALDQPFRYLFTLTPAAIVFVLCSHMQTLILP